MSCEKYCEDCWSVRQTKISRWHTGKRLGGKQRVKGR